jgi:hypothetical protein
MKLGPQSGGDTFMCITCRRGPPYTKKYAKNQCQTCYKKNKKRIEGPHGYSQNGADDFYSMSQNTFNPRGMHPMQYYQEGYM